MAKVKLVTPQGYEFWYESFVNVRGQVLALDSLTPGQKEFVMTSVEVNAMNAAAAGRGIYRAEGLPTFEEVFPRMEPGA